MEEGTRVAAGGDILDPDGNDVTAAKLAVDRQIIVILLGYRHRGGWDRRLRH
jgi:hypothetical protein